MGDPVETALFARRLYTGADDDPEHDVLVQMAVGKITSLQPGAAPPTAGVPCADIVTPGLIDLQINGAADIQFNHDPTVAGLSAMAAGARQGGTALLLPTFTTAPERAYEAGIAAVRAARSARVPGILGIHIEGPFLSPERPGIHPQSCIRPLDDRDVDLIAGAAQDMPVLLTIAPECQAPARLKRLAAAGVVLFAGHSAASAEEMQAARARGLRGATHLFNAMSQMTGRAPGVVGEVLAQDAGFAGIIADGHHVHPMNLALAARCLPDGLCLVTDAMQTLAGRQTQFDLYGTPITLAEGRLTGPDGTLAGAHLSMQEAVANMCRFTGVPLGRVLRMATRTPARALGLDATLGQVAVGRAATLSLFSEDLRCQGVMIDGSLLPVS